MSQLHISSLPNEMLLRIFHKLPPQDLKSAVLVSRLWSELGDDPSLWTWAVVPLHSSQDLHKLQQTRKLQLLQEVEVNCCGYRKGRKCNCNESELNELFMAISETATVKRIGGNVCMECCSVIDPNLLVSLLNRLEKLCIWFGVEENSFQLTEEQTELLFAAMAKETNLETLTVYQMSSKYKFNPVLGGALSNVTNLNLVELGVDLQPIISLFSAILSEDRPLRKLDLRYWVMHRIDPDFLGSAVNQLEEMTINNVVNSDQITAIIRTLVDGESKLKRLRLLNQNDEDFETVDKDLIRKAKEKVGEFFSTWEPSDTSYNGSSDDELPAG